MHFAVVCHAFLSAYSMRRTYAALTTMAEKPDTITNTAMIRLWLSRGTSISIQEQLCSQLILGILSRRLAPGERLPSVRELARRLHVHANTVSAVYQDLAHRGWVNRKHGSGVFVHPGAVPHDSDTLESFVRSCINEGRARGFSWEALRRGFREITDDLPAVLVVLDPDVHLAQVLAAEIGEALGLIVQYAGLENAPAMLTDNVCVLVTETVARQSLPWLRHANQRTIRLKSMQDVLFGYQRPAKPTLIAVVSQSESILRWASTLLSALGFSQDSVLLRNPRCASWQNGLAACGLIATDIVGAGDLSRYRSSVVFRLVSDEFLNEINDLAASKNNDTCRGS